MHYHHIKSRDRAVGLKNLVQCFEKVQVCGILSQIHDIERFVKEQKQTKNKQKKHNQP